MSTERSKYIFRVHLEERRIQASRSRSRAIDSVLQNTYKKRCDVRNHKDLFENELRKLKQDDEIYMVEKRELVACVRRRERSIPREF